LVQRDCFIFKNIDHLLSIKNLGGEIANSSAAQRKRWACELIENDFQLENLLPLLHNKDTALPTLWLISDIASLDAPRVQKWIPSLFEACSHLPFTTRAHSLSRYCMLCGIPPEVEGFAVDQLFEWALHPETTQMTKRSSLLALKNHLEIRPELKEELISVLEILEGKYSPTFEKFRLQMITAIQRISLEK
jgi:hypothetical protein